MSPTNESSGLEKDSYYCDIETDGHFASEETIQQISTSRIFLSPFRGQTTKGSIVTSPSEDDSSTQPNYSSVNLNSGVQTVDSSHELRVDFNDLRREIKVIANNIGLTSVMPKKRHKTTVSNPSSAQTQNLKKTSLFVRADNCISKNEVRCLLEMVKVIFDLGAEKQLIFYQDCDGDTKLHLVIIFLLEDVAMAIIDSVTDYTVLDAQNQLFQTPLILAVLLDMPKLARRLMSCGIEIDLCDYAGNTALHVACRNKNFKMAELLMTPITRDEISKNKSEIPYRRIPQDLNIRNFDGETCMEIAFKNKDILLMDLLLEKGANFDQRCLKTGRTLLYKACLSGDMELVKYLISKNCDINMRAYDGSTPFDAARANGHWLIATILAERGAESDSDEEEG